MMLAATSASKHGQQADTPHEASIALALAAGAAVKVAAKAEGELATAAATLERSNRQEASAVAESKQWVMAMVAAEMHASSAATVEGGAVDTSKQKRSRGTSEADSETRWMEAVSMAKSAERSK